MKQALYNFHPHFVYRTPASPLQAAPPDLPAFFGRTKEALFKEAIYLASPVLYDELVKWHSGQLNDKKDEAKLITSLYKYYQRMQSRCTPYGLFAGCGTGAWSGATAMVHEGRVTRHTRLDMHYLCALAQQLNQHEAIALRLKYFPNNSTYFSGGQLRYVEYKYMHNRRVHQISSVEHSDYLQLVMNGAAQGATIDTLKRLLVSDEIGEDEALGFIRELIDSQLLVSELEPAVTGDEFIHQVIGTLKSLVRDGHNEEIASMIALLNEVQEQLTAIDRHTGNAVERYRAVFEKLKLLSPSTEESNLFQTDLYKADTEISLDSGMQAQLSDAIAFLNRLNRKEEQPLLKSFRERFYEQYESDEVPLLEALDTETGIGYTGKDTSGVNALIDDLYLPGQAAPTDMAWGDRQALLHRRLLQAVQNNEYTVVFTDEDAKEEDKLPLNLPDTLPLMFRVAGGKLLLQSCGGASAAGLLGRFAHGSEAIHRVIGDITAHEESLNPGKILAEIVHLPESRVGNILLRPVLRKYELPYLGKSALPKESQVCLQDIRISVQNNRIILRSVLHDKEVIPRLSTAHNYVNNALPVYQFLGDMQKQYFDKHRFEFSWGAIGNHFKFLPRAEYKGVILKRARWLLDKADFSLLLNEPGPDHMQQVHRWRTQLGMPQRVVLSEFDNELLVDLNDPMSLGAFAGAIKKRPSIILEEFLFDPQDLLVKDASQQGYTNEFIAILLKQAPPSLPSVTLRKVAEASSTAQAARSFGPGSEWLYYKIYGGIKTTDKLLCSVIKPLAEEIALQGWADRFFFIRYADPQTHLRLRFHVPDRQNLGAVMAMVHDAFAPCLSDGSISKLQMDTYQRELERYGSSSIGLAESFFHIDSAATLSMLDMIDDSDGGQTRWQFALRSIDELLDGFAYDADGKLQLMEKLKNGFVEEHGGSKDLKIQLDTKFRAVRALADDILDKTRDDAREIFPLIELLKQKQQQLQPIAGELISLKNRGLLQPGPDGLMESLIHMMMNRIFPARQRTYEMVIYDLLHRCYKSIAARGRQQVKVKKTAVS